MSKAFADAIYDRWGDAGLTSSVGALDPGDTESAPEGTELPRVHYEIDGRGGISRSRGSRIKTSNVRITVWNDGTWEDLWTRVDAIESAFVNSENAGTNPLNMSGGDILDVELVEPSSVLKVDSDVYMGIVQLNVNWRVANSTPS